MNEGNYKKQCGDDKRREEREMASEYAHALAEENRRKWIEEKREKAAADMEHVKQVIERRKSQSSF